MNNIIERTALLWMSPTNIWSQNRYWLFVMWIRSLCTVVYSRQVTTVDVFIRSSPIQQSEELRHWHIKTIKARSMYSLLQFCGHWSLRCLRNFEIIWWVFWFYFKLYTLFIEEAYQCIVKVMETISNYFNPRINQTPFCSPHTIFKLQYIPLLNRKISFITCRLMIKQAQWQCVA